MGRFLSKYKYHWEFTIECRFRFDLVFTFCHIIVYHNLLNTLDHLWIDNHRLSLDQQLENRIGY